jgi:hypothetical protein
VIHLPVKQHTAGIADQSQRPAGDENGADDAHQRVEPVPAVEHASEQGDDGQHRGGGIGDDVQIGGAQIEVVITVAMVSVFGMVVVVIIVMLTRS